MSKRRRSPPKAMRYPPKFRQTLEKMRSAKEVHEASAPEPAEQGVFSTFYDNFLLPGIDQVHVDFKPQITPGRAWNFKHRIKNRRPRFAVVPAPFPIQLADPAADAA